MNRFIYFPWGNSGDMYVVHDVLFFFGHTIVVAVKVTSIYHFVWHRWSMVKRRFRIGRSALQHWWRKQTRSFRRCTWVRSINVFFLLIITSFVFKKIFSLFVFLLKEKKKFLNFFCELQTKMYVRSVSDDNSCLTSSMLWT